MIGSKLPLRKQSKEDTKTKLMPPEVGIGELWELLSFGISKKLLFKKGYIDEIKNWVKNIDIKKTNKEKFIIYFRFFWLIKK